MTDTTNRPVIFLAFANDRDETVGYLRNLPDEARRLREVLVPAERAGLCEVVLLQNCTAGDIFKVFQDPRYRNRVAIFHYGGHANGYQLLLESAGGQSNAADAGGLAAFLAQQQGLQLVFLNGCSTQPQTQGLLDANISVVISTSRAIDDKVATDFASLFYQGLASGATIRTANHEAVASQQTASGNNTRGLYFGSPEDSPGQLEADRWPWNLYLSEGCECADQWNLPDAVNDPLFGLPPLPQQDLPESPYRHLNWFTRKDAEVFFGRGYQIRELYDRLTAPRTPPILLFYGQSGVGKSSILDAGLIPRLERDYEVRYLRRGESGLLETLRLAFLPEARDVPVDAAWRAKEEQLNKPLIVFLDQVEELYTRPNANLTDELDQLLRVLKSTFGDPNFRPRGKLVLGFRKEWLAELEAQMIKYELPRTKLFLERLDRRGIIEVVFGPTRSDRLQEHFGLTVDEALAQIIADDLLADRGSAISTTLQILLSKMWTKASEENYEQPRFSCDMYNDLQHEGILLSDFLDQQLKAFHSQLPGPADSGLLIDVLALHTTNLGTSNQCSRDTLQKQYAHVSDILPKLLQKCQDLYLLTEATTSQKDHTKTTRLAHDTLAPLIRASLDHSDKPGQRSRRILDSRIQEWSTEKSRPDESDRTPNERLIPVSRGALLDETDLAIVEDGKSGTRTWTSSERQMVDASRNRRSRRVWNRRIASIAAGLGFVFVVVAVWVGWQFQVDRDFQAQQRKFEEEKRTLAEKNEADAKSLAKNREARALADEGLRRDEAGDTVAAAHLYARAADVLVEAPEQQLEDRLRLGYFSQTYPKLIHVLEHPSPISSISLTPDGRLLVSAYKQYNTAPNVFRMRGSPDARASVALVWDVSDGKLVHVLDGHKGPVYSADITPDGQLVRTRSLDSFDSSKSERKTSEAFWDIAKGDSASPADGGRNPPNTMITLATSPDARWMLCVNAGALGDGSLRTDDNAFLWDCRSGEVTHKLEGHDDLVIDAAFDTQSGLVATASKDKTVRVWRIDNLELQDVLQGHIDRINSVRFSQDGKRILTTSDDKSARVWRVRTPQTGAIYSTPEPSLIAECHRPQVARTSAATKVEVTAGLGMGSNVTIREGGLEEAAFSADGRFVLTAGDSWDDRSARLWSADSGQLIATLEGHGGAVTAVAFSLDGTLLLTGSDDHTVRVWTWNPMVSEGKELTGHRGRVSDVFYSANGLRVITVGEVVGDGSVRMRDSRTGELLTAIGTSKAYTARLCNSDKLLVTTCWDRLPEFRLIERIRVWDGVTGLLRRTYDYGGGYASLLAVTNDGGLAAYSEDGGDSLASSPAVNLCNLVSGEQVQLRQADSVLQLRFVPESPYLAVRSTNAVSIWNVETHQVIHTFGSVFGSVDVSPNGKLLAAPTNENVAAIWSLETGELVSKLKGHSDSIRYVRFSPDGNILISSADDKTLRVWDCNRYRTIHILQGHTRPPEGFVVSRNSQFVLSFAGSSYTGVSKDNSARLWSTRTGKLILKRQFEDPVVAVGLHPEASSFVVSSANRYTGKVHLFQLPTIDLPTSKMTSWIKEWTGVQLDDAGGLQPLTPLDWRTMNVEGVGTRRDDGLDSVPWFEVFDRLVERQDIAGAAWAIRQASVAMESSDSTLSGSAHAGSATGLLRGADFLAEGGRGPEAMQFFSQVASMFKVSLASHDSQSELPTFDNRRMWQCSITLWTKVVSDDAADADARLRRSLSATRLAKLFGSDGKHTDAIELYRLALTDRQALHESHPRTVLYEYHLCGGLANLGIGLKAASQTEEAAKLLDQAIVIAKGLVEREPDNAEYQRYHDSIKNNLAEMRE